MNKTRLSDFEYKTTVQENWIKKLMKIKKYNFEETSNPAHVVFSKKDITPDKIEPIFRRLELYK